MQRIETSTATQFPPLKNRRALWYEKAAFTLAEVMIVVVIIGVVAVLVLPNFIQDMSERMNSNREANIAQKITKSVEIMSVNGDYENFLTTEDFVSRLQKYLKVIKICNNEHLNECWPAKVVTASDGNKYEVKNAKTGTQLHTNTTTNVVGLVLADGANILLTYNPQVSAPSSEASFSPYKKKLPTGGGKFQEFAYSSNAMSAIDYVVDLNGSGGPNSEPDKDGKFYDIRSFRLAKFSNAETSCEAKGGFKVGGVCVVILTNYEPINCAGSNPPSYCNPLDTHWFVDYWAGAKKACADIGLNMPSNSIVNNLFKTNDTNLAEYNKSQFFTSTYSQTNSWSACVVSNDCDLKFLSRDKMYSVICTE